MTAWNPAFFPNPKDFSGAGRTSFLVDAHRPDNDQADETTFPWVLYMGFGLISIEAVPRVPVGRPACGGIAVSGWAMALRLSVPATRGIMPP